MNDQRNLLLAIFATLFAGLLLIAWGCGVTSGKWNFGLAAFGITLAWVSLSLLETLNRRK